MIVVVVVTVVDVIVTSIIILTVFVDNITQKCASQQILFVSWPVCHGQACTTST